MRLALRFAASFSSLILSPAPTTSSCRNPTVLSANVRPSPPLVPSFAPTSLLATDIANSSDGKSIAPVFGNLFLNEPIPTGGSLDVSDLPGFGLILNPAAKLISSKLFLAPNPENGLSMTDDEKLARKVAINGGH